MQTFSLNQVAEKMSLVVVFALTKLREQHRGATSEGKLPFTCFSVPKQHADLLLCPQSDRRRYLPTEHLQEILQGLVKAALRRDSSVLLRGNIYGALLNYLQFTRPPPQSLVAHDNSMVRKPARHERLLCSSPSTNSLCTVGPIVFGAARGATGVGQA